MLNKQLLTAKTRGASLNSVRNKLPRFFKQMKLVLLLALMLLTPQKASASWDYKDYYAFDHLSYEIALDGKLRMFWRSILFDDLGEDEGFIGIANPLWFCLSLYGEDFQTVGYVCTDQLGNSVRMRVSNQIGFSIGVGEPYTERIGKADCTACNFWGSMPYDLNLLNTRIGFRAEGSWANIPFTGSQKDIWVSKTEYIDLHHTFGIRPIEWDGDFTVDENGRIKVNVKIGGEGRDTYETDRVTYLSFRIDGAVVPKLGYWLLPNDMMWYSGPNGPCTSGTYIWLNTIGKNMRSKFTLDPCNVFEHDHDLDANGGKAYHTANAGARTFLPMPLATITSVEGNPDSSLVHLRWTADNENYLGQGNNRWVIYRDGKKIAVLPQSTLSYTDPGITPGTSPVYTIYYVHNGWSEDAKRSELKSNDLAALWKDKTGAIFISSEADWKSFTLSVADGETFEGQTVRLAQDIIVATMVGSSDRKFKGTFDGGGHTLTFNLTTSEQYAAPFRYTEGAVIRNLTVNGKIQTSQKFAAGIIAHNEGASTLEHCTSNITINSTVNGDGSHGGLVAYNAPFCTMDITDCAFYGQLLGSATTHCGGLVGYNDYGPVLFIRSAADWNTFASNVEDGTSYAGQTILLLADINVSEMVSKHYNRDPFGGIFEGGGHTITIQFAKDGYTALFDYIKGATIRNLIVGGTIKGSKKENNRRAAIASSMLENSTIENCWSRVRIVDECKNTNHNPKVGAIVGYSDGNNKITNCLFTGSIEIETEGSDEKGGGMVGDVGSPTIYLTNSLFCPSSLEVNYDERSELENSRYFYCASDGYGKITNCYYNAVAKKSRLNKQGTDASNMSNQQLCNALGDGWEIKENQVVPKMGTMSEKVGLITFTDCVFAPQLVTMSTTGSSTLCRNANNAKGIGRSNFTRCTYTQAFGTAQGSKIGQETLTHSIGVDKAILHGTVKVSDNAAQAGETVTLTVTSDEGYSISSVTYNDGVEHTISCKDGVYSFVMPAKDVTANATFTTIEYGITYDLAEGCLLADNPTSYTVESETFTLAYPVRQNYIFVGWTGTGLEDPTMDVTILKGSTGDRTYTATWLEEEVVLYDNADNHVDEHIGHTCKVVLAGRTIDNEWNTLALPFDVTKEQLDETFGASWALYEFSGSSLENDVLGLSFRKAESIEAGVPYFFRVSDKVGSVTEPVFHGVQMEAADEKPSTTAFVDFLPTLNITQIEGESIKEVLILGGGNTLYNPAVLPAWMRSYRGYFRVHDVNMDVAQFRMSFDIDDEVSGIVSVRQDSRQDCIYTLDGQQLKSQPTQRGFYITGNKKVMVK